MWDNENAQALLLRVKPGQITSETAWSYLAKNEYLYAQGPSNYTHKFKPWGNSYTHTLLDMYKNVHRNTVWSS